MICYVTIPIKAFYLLFFQVPLGLLPPLNREWRPMDLVTPPPAALGIYDEKGRLIPFTLQTKHGYFVQATGDVCPRPLYSAEVPEAYKTPRASECCKNKIMCQSAPFFGQHRKDGGTQVEGGDWINLLSVNKRIKTEDETPASSSAPTLLTPHNKKPRPKIPKIERRHKPIEQVAKPIQHVQLPKVKPKVEPKAEPKTEPEVKPKVLFM